IFAPSLMEWMGSAEVLVLAAGGCVGVSGGVDGGSETVMVQGSKMENSPIQRLPTLHLSVLDPLIQDSSASSPTDSTAQSPTSSLSQLSISKWSARGSETCASPIDGSQDAADIEPPPDGGWGVVSSYGVYLAYYLSHPLPSATPTTYALLGGLNFGTATLSAPLLTILTRLTSPRLLILLGAFLQTTSLLLASLATQTWHLHLTQGLLLGLAVGFTYIPSVAILPQWFDARRSIAAGIAAAGSGPRVVVARYSGGFREYVSRRGAVATDAQCGDSAETAWVCGEVAGEAMGMSVRRAADVTGMVNVGTALGRPFVGALSDRWGRIEVAGVVTAVCGVSVFAVWVPAEGEAVVMLFAVVAGATLGTFWVAIGPLCVEVVGLVELPALLSLAWMVIVVPCTVSEVIALKLRTPGTAHPYLGPQVLAGTAYLVAAGIMLELWRVHRKKDRRASGVDVEEGVGEMREERMEDMVSGDSEKGMEEIVSGDGQKGMEEIVSGDSQKEVKEQNLEGKA
ncbi:hypothetical protein V500_04065, partial [Pseudogymnoascus sp. VKM F-4518 (FW-2643)]